jgi:murein DD-endopeptidase MepM/ murein hydrolase activator NlpD
MSKNKEWIFWALTGVGISGIAYYFLVHKKKVSSSSGFTFPTDNHTITSPFGYRTHPVSGESDVFHNGIDLRAAEGDPIYAPADGVVTSEYSNDAGGNQLLIKHSNGFTSGYAHLSAYLVTEGETVRKGQVIAYAGATGTVTAAHLHFTLKDQSGSYLDPSTYLS